MTMPDGLETTPAEPLKRGHIEEIVLVLLVLLSGIGVVVNDYGSPADGVPHVAVDDAGVRHHQHLGRVVARAAPRRAGGQHRADADRALARRRRRGAADLRAAAYGRMTSEAAGSAVLVVLALAAFLAGVYTDWRLSVLGVVLGVAVIGFAYVERVALVIVPLLPSR